MVGGSDARVPANGVELEQSRLTRQTQRQTVFLLPNRRVLRTPRIPMIALRAQAAMLILDQTDPVALAQALIRCESVTPADAGALAALAAALETVGFTCHMMTFSEPGTPDIQNLYARIGTSAPNLCFAGHTDVVPVGDLAAWTSPPFGAVIRDGVLYGRGAVDMKGAIACFVAAVSRHLTPDPTLPGSISFLITGDEEGPSINGTVKVLDWLAARGEKLDACLIGEPSNPHWLGEEIKIGRRGSMNGEIVVHGKQGHAAYPRKAENPVPKLIRILDRLSRTPIDTGTTNFEASNLEVTVIDVANTATNVIPAQARAKFNVRYNDLHTRAKIEDWVRLQCDAASQAIEARYDLTFSGTGDVFLTQPGPLVETLSVAVAAITGRTPALTTGGGTSDARFIHFHCPVVEFGLVNETIHQVDECVPTTDLETLTRIYERFIAGFFAVT
jgi:succinyl-diaminopimelate desuccinylase